MLSVFFVFFLLLLSILPFKFLFQRHGEIGEGQLAWDLRLCWGGGGLITCEEECGRTDWRSRLPYT